MSRRRRCDPARAARGPARGLPRPRARRRPIPRRPGRAAGPCRSSASRSGATGSSRSRRAVPEPESYESESWARSRSPGLVGTGTDIEPVPVTGLAANFSPMPRIAPPLAASRCSAQPDGAAAGALCPSSLPRLACVDVSSAPVITGVASSDGYVWGENGVCALSANCGGRSRAGGCYGRLFWPLSIPRSEPVANLVVLAVYLGQDALADRRVRLHDSALGERESARCPDRAWRQPDQADVVDEPADVREPLGQRGELLVARHEHHITSTELEQLLVRPLLRRSAPRRGRRSCLHRARWRVGARSQSSSGPPRAGRAPPGRPARSACRGRSSPRRGRARADCAGSSARSRSAASRRPRSGSRVPLRRCRNRREARKPDRGSARRVPPPRSPHRSRRAARSGGSRGPILP